MRRIFLHKVFAAHFWLLVGAGIVWLMAMQFLQSMDYALLSTRTAPNGRLIIHEFRSQQDGGGHAPYGQILALSHGARLKSPDEGFVFFAGYCSEALQYRWLNDEAVSVRCQEGAQSGGPRTLALRMYGIHVIYAGQ